REQTVSGQTKILVGGTLAWPSGTSGPGGIARFTQAGALDSTFQVGSGANSAVNAIVVQSGGRIVLGGNFTLVNGQQRKRLAALNADGSVDSTFLNWANSGLNGNAQAILD